MNSLFANGSGVKSKFDEAKAAETRKFILEKLIDVVKKCQTKYGDKKELATDKDPLVIDLCDTWEKAVSYGLRQPNLSVFKNVQDIVSGGFPDDPFWNFLETHLTNHEKQRFDKLKHVHTKQGKTKALIRSALNEHSLERYILMLLGDASLKDIYENWALMQDAEAVNLLPSIAAGLGTILFAIIIDTPEINAVKTIVKKEEPIICPPRPVGPSKKSIAIERQIVSIESKTSDSSNEKLTNESFASSSNEMNIENSSLGFETVVQVYNASDANCYIDSASEIEVAVAEDVFEKDSAEYIYSIDDIATSSSRSKYSSSVSSTSSLSLTDVNKLKEKVRELTEKCAILEARVTDLSIENDRLRYGSKNSTYKTVPFTVNIPRVVLLSSGSKKYSAYEIHVNWTNGLEESVVLRRYSEFYAMHQKLKKAHYIVKVLDFPPKKKIGNMNTSFVEDRRQRLQAYLRHLITIIPEVSECTTLDSLQNALPILK